MVNPVVGFRFRPTDEEILKDYLRPKNLDNNTNHVDRVFNTINISSFDPWELRDQSIMKSEDQVWCFFGRKENKYNRGDRQIRKTKSGYWKKTGKPTEIKRKSGNREKIGEKWVLVFHMSNKKKTKWVLHEYHLFSPDQVMMTYTVCKVKFKGEASEISSPPSGEIEVNHSSITQMNSSRGLSTGSEVGTAFEFLQSQEIEIPPQFSGLRDVFEETQLTYDAMHKDISNLSTDGFNNLLNDDAYEQRKVMFMQENRSNHGPKKPITGVFIGYSSDDDDDDISGTTGSIQTSTTCDDSFGSSNHRVDQIIDPQKVNQTPSEETKILGQEKTKSKRASIFYRIIQRFIKKIQLCTSI